uniref:NAD(P)-binding domain-containing protein n=1 Tax=Psilocybe cubensis TaxID=181762 RepID=A0A8H7XTM1_PSICU
MNLLIRSPHTTMSKKVIIVGGHGNVSLRLAKLLSATKSVTSIIRDASQNNDIMDVSATPLVLSLEDSPVSDFTKAFTGQDVVYFSAGAGGKGGEERTKKVDYEGAVKVFDAIEGVSSAKPRLILVSAIDIRDPEKIPAHYNEDDIARSKKYREALKTYVHWKYEADKNLTKRTAFKWTILRPGTLSNNPGKGTASIGRAHLSNHISRDDVAKVLALLADREDAAGLAIDFVGGDTPIEEGLDAFIKKGETDFLG